MIIRKHKALQLWIVSRMSSTKPFFKDGMGDNKFVITVTPV